MHWLEISEYAALTTAVIGTIAAISSASWQFAIIPVLVSLILNVINRLRIGNILKTRDRELAARIDREIQAQNEAIQQEIAQARSFSTALVKQTIAAQKEPAALEASKSEELKNLEQKYDLQQQLMAAMQAHVAGVEDSLKDVVSLLDGTGMANRVDSLEQNYNSMAEQLGIDNASLFGARPAGSTPEQPMSTIGMDSPDVDIAPLLDMISEDLISGDLISGDLSGDLLSGDLSGDLWDRPNWRLEKTIAAHEDWVRCMNFTPDGQKLVSGSFDKTIKVWQLATGTAEHTLEKHTKGVFALAVSPDGKLLASGSWDESIELWDLIAGKSIDSLKHHQASVRSLAMSPDSTILYSGSFDNSIGVCRLPSGELIQKISSAEPIAAIALSKDGQILASTGDDGTIQIWDVDKAAVIANLAGNNHCICSMAIGPDRQLVAAGTVNGYTIVWHLNERPNGKQQLSPLQAIKSHSGQINSCLFSPDGQYLMTGSVDGKAKVWYKGNSIGFRDKARSILKGDPGRSVMSAAISPDGKTVAVGGADGSIQLWSQS